MITSPPGENFFSLFYERAFITEKVALGSHGQQLQRSATEVVLSHPDGVILNVPQGRFEILVPHDILQDLGVTALGGGVRSTKSVTKGMGRAPPAAYARSPAQAPHYLVDTLVGQGAALPQEDVD